jgi:hypothetical protein
LEKSNSFRGTPTQSFEQWTAASNAQRVQRESRVADQIRKHSVHQF